MRCQLLVLLHYSIHWDLIYTIKPSTHVASFNHGMQWICYLQHSFSKFSLHCAASFLFSSNPFELNWLKLKREWKNSLSSFTVSGAEEISWSLTSIERAPLLGWLLSDSSRWTFCPRHELWSIIALLRFAASNGHKIVNYLLILNFSFRRSSIIFRAWFLLFVSFNPRRRRLPLRRSHMSRFWPRITNCIWRIEISRRTFALIKLIIWT